MTEKEKALNGLEFVRGDLDLKAARERAEILCFEYNTTHPGSVERKRQILQELLPQFNDTLTIKAPFLCEYGTYLYFGKNFFANYNCKFMDGGKIVFGNDVLIGPDCTFVTAHHPTDPQRRLAGIQQFKSITVGNNVWFGAGVVVLPGVSIGNDCVIGAGSVVVKDIPDRCVAAGNPCRVTRFL